MRQLLALVLVATTMVTVCVGGPATGVATDDNSLVKNEIEDGSSGFVGQEVEQPDEEYINSLLPKDERESLYGGDIKLTPLQKEQIKAMEKEQRNTQAEHEIERRAVVYLRNDKWPNGRVPYVISSRLGSFARNVISDAIQQYNDDTCIRFVKRTNERDYVRFIRDYGCYSYIGRIGGPQDISIGSGCESKGIVMHEMFHALGRWHEQSRPDRDNHIRVNYENIERRARSNFEKLTNSDATTNNIPYDYRSLMHYRAYSFSRNGRPTIEPIVANVRLSDLGQRGGFTTDDRNHALKLYCQDTTSTWTSWSQWSSCSASCGTGRQTRTRTCQGTTCSGSSSQTRNCNTNSCPRWGSWSSWGSCSATCGGGRQTRFRSCIGLGRCSGSNTQSRSCATTACPVGRWGSWSSWGSCSATCGGGQQRRSRSCIGPGRCSGASSDTRRCGTSSCPGRLTSWTSWSACSADCGPGTQSRTRSCVGGSCSGETREARDCVKAPFCLQASGEWSAWGSWSDCSASCGYTGRRSRTRTCNGDACTGSNREVQNCNRGTCATQLSNGPGWGSWGVWGRCSRMCGGGYQSRRRTCLRRQTRRIDCPGSSFQLRGCNYQSCSTPTVTIVTPPKGTPFTAGGHQRQSCRQVNVAADNTPLYTLNQRTPFTSNIVSSCVSLAAEHGFHYVGVSGGYCNSGSDSLTTYTRYSVSGRCVGGTGLLSPGSLQVHMDVYSIREN